MAADRPKRPITEPRRKDRAVEDESWMRAFLSRSPVGTLATVDGDQPFINTNLFVYDEQEDVVYLHTARAGRTRENLERNAKVCLSVFEMGRLLPADTALEFSAEYAGVVAFGRGAVVYDRAEKKRALRLLLDKYAPHLEPGRDYRPMTEDELKRTSVYRVAIEGWSGKRKKVEADFPGAYWDAADSPGEFEESD